MKKILTTLFILLATFNSAFAINESKKISLQEAIDIALETNPQIKISKLNVQTSTNEIKSATRLQNPEIYTFQNMGIVKTMNLGN